MIEVTNRSWNIVGNVLGTKNQQRIYESFPTGTGVSTDNAIISAGWNDEGYGNDTQTVATIYIHGNYDTVNKTIMWNPTNSDHTIPTSFLYSSKPSWFGNCPWPPYDPAHPTAASMTNIPAGYRAAFGVDPPAAPVCNPGPLMLSHSRTNVVISWSNTPCAYVLQYNTSVTSPSGWTNVSQTPVLVGGRNYVTNPMSPAFRAYRLHLGP